MKYLIILAFIQISISDSVQCHKETGLVVDCTSTYDPVCGYNTDKQKLETFTNGCIGCYYSGNVSYYISGPCVVSSSVVSQNITNNTKYECSIQRPDLQYSCNNTQSVVCAQLTYDGSTSEREFNNDCQACNNSDVASYYKGYCYQAFLGLTFLLSMIL